MGYFPNGVVYKKGGVASAFNKVKTNELDNRSLFQVKGKRRPRLVEVDCEWNSFNEGDVFILDYKNWLIQWNGKEANRFEKLKACQSLQELKARNGKQTTVVVEQGRTHKVIILVVLWFLFINFIQYMQHPYRRTSYESTYSGNYRKFKGECDEHN